MKSPPPVKGTVTWTDEDDTPTATGPVTSWQLDVVGGAKGGAGAACGTAPGQEMVAAGPAADADEASTTTGRSDKTLATTR